MSLTLGKGPLGGSPGGAFNFSLDDAPKHKIFFEDYPRRLRGVIGDTTVVDTYGARLLHETAIKPVAYVPLADLDQALLTPTDTRTHCPFKGDASYWTVAAGDRVVEDALWAYEEPLPAAEWLRGYGAFYWDRVDAWYIEDEQVGSLRDPYHRVDVHAGSRSVVVRVDGTAVAESDNPLMLFETGLRPRVYIPREDVADGVLEPSPKRTHCPYKGDASYWSVRVDGRLAEDVAWSYEDPLSESVRVAGAVSFDGEDVEIELG